MASAVLFVGTMHGLSLLFGFIAYKNLGASELWVGVIASAGYCGYFWNFFLNRLTARLSLRRGIVVMMATSALLLSAAAWQDTAGPYCLLVMVVLLMLGLYEVQYGTLVRHLYDQDSRPRLLSRRHLAIAVATAGFALGFGAMCEASGQHLPAFLVAAVIMGGAAAVFHGIPMRAEHHMEPFHPWDVVRTALGDPRFRRVVIILTLYGWVGAGSQPILTVLYKRLEFGEAQVGQLVAIGTVGTLLGLLLITPRLRFAGGISNYRLCFGASSVAMLVYGAVAFNDPGPWSFAMMGIGAFVFGISLAGFSLAMQTTGINLAPPGKTTLYVNALMIVLGVRGMVMPLLSAKVVGTWDIRTALTVSIVVACVCAGAVLMPGIDGRAVRATADDPQRP